MIIKKLKQIPRAITKVWRQKNISKNSKDNKVEKFQKRVIKEDLGVDLNKYPLDSEGKKQNHVRINKRTLEFRNLYRITNREDFVDWTEDFDGISQFNSSTFYWNLKMIPDSGGSQNRSIRPVIAMVEAFAKHIQKNKCTNKFFICITDGEYYLNFADMRSGNTRSQFEYAIDQVNKNLRSYFFIGPSHDLKDWWEAVNEK